MAAARQDNDEQSNSNLRSQVTQLSWADLALKHERAVILGRTSTKFCSDHFFWAEGKSILFVRTFGIDQDGKPALKLAVMQKNVVTVQAGRADSTAS